MRVISRFVRCEEGATTVEYAVVLALILLVCVGAITSVGGQTFNYWGNNRDQLEAALAQP